MAAQPHEITQLLQAWSGGEKSAFDKLIPLVYGDLRSLARRRMAGERENNTLQTTALINEAYVRLVDSNKASWSDRAHFFAVCSRVMRQILVDAARARGSHKRGGDIRFVELDEAMAASVRPSVNVIALDDALNALSAFDARKSQVVELRIFGGLSAKETADVLQISTDTVTRDMQIAAAWLRRELMQDEQRDA